MSDNYVFIFLIFIFFISSWISDYFDSKVEITKLRADQKQPEEKKVEKLNLDKTPEYSQDDFYREYVKSFPYYTGPTIFSNSRQRKRNSFKNSKPRSYSIWFEEEIKLLLFLKFKLKWGNPRIAKYLQRTENAIFLQLEREGVST